MTAVTDHPLIYLSIMLGVESAQFFFFLSTTQFHLLYSHNIVMDKNSIFLLIWKCYECILISFGKDIREIPRCVFCLKNSWFKKSCQPVSGKKAHSTWCFYYDEIFKTKKNKRLFNLLLGVKYFFSTCVLPRYQIVSWVCKSVAITTTYLCDP